MSSKLTKEKHDEIHASLTGMPYLNFLGIEIMYLKSESVKLKLTIKEEFSNSIGLLHGGVHASILDVALGTAIRTYTTRMCITLNLNVSYLDAADTDSIYAEARVISGGYNNMFAEGEIYDENGKIVAKAVGTFKVLKN